MMTAVITVESQRVDDPWECYKPRPVAKQVQQLTIQLELAWCGRPFLRKSLSCELDVFRYPAEQLREEVLRRLERDHMTYSTVDAPDDWRSLTVERVDIIDPAGILEWLRIDPKTHLLPYEP